MKTLTLVCFAVFFLLSAVALPAQNTLPDLHNDSCWSSLAALRACQLQAYNEQQDYALRCTSYPEYQCLPDYISLEPKASAKHSSKKVSKSSQSAGTSSASPGTPADANPQTANSN